MKLRIGKYVPTDSNRLDVIITTDSTDPAEVVKEVIAGVNCVTNNAESWYVSIDDDEHICYVLDNNDVKLLKEKEPA